MAELLYSNEAENVLSRFHRVDAMVYVEGIDDLPFWEYIFDKFAGFTVKLNDVGGVSEIEKYILKIENGDIDAIVACDADFSYASSFSTHKNVLRSYGYSIENTMICKKSLKKIIRSVGRVQVSSIDDSDIVNWFELLEADTCDLVIHDIANHILGEGKIVAGDNCTRFMRSAKSSVICPKKIQEHITNVNVGISRRLENKIVKSLNESNRTEYDLLRGRFLFSASLKYVISSISKLGKNVVISNDSFFGALIIAFEAVFDSSHGHYNYYREIVQRVAIRS